MRKSALYNGPVADAALDCVLEVVDKAGDASFVPVPAETLAPARTRPLMRQADRAFRWTDPTDEIISRIRAADGSPGVRTSIDGLEVYAYDAHRGPAVTATPGALLLHHDGAVLAATGDGSVWLGHLRAALRPGQTGLKLPATRVLADRLDSVPEGPGDIDAGLLYRQVRYRRDGRVGWVEFDFYNGAMAPGHCRRLLAALRHAAAQDTDVLVLVSGTEAFSNGIDLNTTEAAANPAAAAWANIRAINDVCREIVCCVGQTVIAGYAGSAGAGGVMLGLGADIVAARAGIVLNAHYDIGLYGSELHTLTLPRRVGDSLARQLLDEKLPISADHALSIGLVDQVGPRDPRAYREWLAGLADACAHRGATVAARREVMPPEAYEVRELAQMSHDMFDDRSGFAAARQAFVAKVRVATPARLRMRVEPAAGSPARARVTVDA